MFYMILLIFFKKIKENDLKNDKEILLQEINEKDKKFHVFEEEMKTKLEFLEKQVKTRLFLLYFINYYNF